MLRRGWCPYNGYRRGSHLNIAVNGFSDIPRVHVSLIILTVQWPLIMEPHRSSLTQCLPSVVRFHMISKLQNLQKVVHEGEGCKEGNFRCAYGGFSAKASRMIHRTIKYTSEWGDLCQPI